MKVHLMHHDLDFDMERELPPNEALLMQDLELKVLLDAMAGQDTFLLPVAKQAVLSGLQNDLQTILYRQAVLKDCLQNKAVVREIYDLAVKVLELKRTSWLGIFTRSPSGILYEAVKLMKMFAPVLGELKNIAEEHGNEFRSQGFTTFFLMLRTELSDEYLAMVKMRLQELDFGGGILMSAELGQGNQGAHYVLRRSRNGNTTWWQRFFCRKPAAYTYRIAERDDAGARALTELQDVGQNLVANVLAQSAEHVSNFFTRLRTELAFYIGCLNLHQNLERKDTAVSFPIPMPTGTCSWHCAGLRDACLALTAANPVIGNEVQADGKHLVIVTGANQGGKSTFLRSVGVAQLMMQSGMFVAAEAFSASLCRGLFTHYKREEDATLQRGKFDEELKRMSDIADEWVSDSMMLFNESFAATNEREGSEIAGQIVRALLEAGGKIFYVTHLYEFAQKFADPALTDVHLLRAERQADGSRTFKLYPGEAQPTSFGADLFTRLFEKGAQN